MRISARKYKVERKNDIFGHENNNSAHQTENQKSIFFIFNHLWLDQNLFPKFSILNLLENGF